MSQRLRRQQFPEIQTRAAVHEKQKATGKRTEPAEELFRRRPAVPPVRAARQHAGAYDTRLSYPHTLGEIIVVDDFYLIYRYFHLLVF